MADKPRIFVDVNVFVDISEKRSGWYSSLGVINGVRRGNYEGYISTITVPILYFRRIRVRPDREARNDVWTMVKGFRMVDLNARILRLAINDNKFNDYEDAIQYYSAKTVSAMIVTRNKKDFPTRIMEILNPEEFLRKT